MELISKLTNLYLKLLFTKRNKHTYTKFFLYLVYIQRIMNKNWTRNTTGKHRYDVLGVCDYIHQYAKRTKKAKLCVIDVGCSEAIAIKECQMCLAKHNVILRTVGIDPSKNIKDKAPANLSHFIPKDVTCLNQDIEPADIVICLNVTRFIDINHRSKIIKKCTKLLKDDGILIVDKTGFENSDYSANTINKHPPRRLCDQHYVKKQMEELFWGPIKGYVMVFEKNAAKEFSEQIIPEWEKLNRFQKMCIKWIKLFCQGL